MLITEVLIVHCLHRQHTHRLLYFHIIKVPFILTGTKQNLFFPNPCFEKMRSKSEQTETSSKVSSCVCSVFRVHEEGGEPEGRRCRLGEEAELLSPYLNSTAHSEGPVRPMTDLSELTWSVWLRVSDLMEHHACPVA